MLQTRIKNKPSRIISTLKRIVRSATAERTVEIALLGKSTYLGSKLMPPWYAKAACICYLGSDLSRLTQNIATNMAATITIAKTPTSRTSGEFVMTAISRAIKPNPNPSKTGPTVPMSRLRDFTKLRI